MSYEVMPFGKFKGVKIEQIETSYLCYASDNFDLPLDLVEIIKENIFMRFEISKKGTINEVDLKRAFKNVAVKVHPDKGGSHGEMIGATILKDYLLNILKTC